MSREQNKMCPSLRETQRLETKSQVEIFVTENLPNHGRNKYRWAWKESAEKKVFGSASTIDEITRRSRGMFPDSEIVLLFL